MQKCRCGDNPVVAYVDDFIGACRKRDAHFLWSSFLDLLSELGLQPSETDGHLCPPALQVVGLGILIDLANNTLSVPANKLEKAILLLQDWASYKYATKRQLQKLLGVLLHLSRVIRSGRLFLNRMLETLRRAENLDSQVPIDSNFFEDLQWWLRNCRSWNGISFLRFTQYQNKITLDASSNGYWNDRPGIGGFNYIRNEFFRCTVPNSLAHLHIQDLEFLAHLLAARLWAWSWQGLHLHGFTDNETCRFLLQNG